MTTGCQGGPLTTALRTGEFYFHTPFMVNGLTAPPERNLDYVATSSNEALMYEHVHRAESKLWHPTRRPGYIDPDMIQYSYKLESGLSSGWRFA